MSHFSDVNGSRSSTDCNAKTEDKSADTKHRYVNSGRFDTGARDRKQTSTDHSPTASPRIRGRTTAISYTRYRMEFELNNKRGLRRMNFEGNFEMYLTSDPAIPPAM
jgi:hypothetical protein